MKRRNVDASKEIFVVTEILLFDFELFIGGRVQNKRRTGNSFKLPVLEPFFIHKYLRAHGPVVDTNIVDQAGEESASFVVLTNTDV